MDPFSPRTTTTVRGGEFLLDVIHNLGVMVQLINFTPCKLLSSIIRAKVDKMHKGLLPSEKDR